MGSIKDVLTEMRGRLPLFVGTNSVVKLAFFLRGYEFAMSQLRSEGGDHFLFEFQEFVQQHFNVRISKSWEDVIEFHSSSEDEAVSFFWDVYDRYLERKK